MANNNGDTAFKLSSTMLKIITIILGIAAAYFLTIQSLKIELAAKAEGTAVETLDKKLTNIEVILKEGVVSKEQFYRFSKDVEARLARIEFLLEDRLGDHLEKK